MTRVAEWKADVFLFEEGDVTKAKATLDTRTTMIAGHGTARRNPHDMQVPEIGDELAAGRALTDLGRKLIRTAAEDVEGVEELQQARPQEPRQDPDTDTAP